jgi:hypothetical protein
MTLAHCMKSGLAVVILLTAGGIVLAAEDRPKLGISGVVVDIGFGKGIGVDSVQRGSVAAGLGVRVKSFIYRIEVTYGENQVDKRRTDSFTAVKKALDHEDVSRITLVWRKNGIWYKNSYNVRMKLYGKEQKLEKPDN